jgi:hypothetical protein
MTHKILDGYGTEPRQGGVDNVRDGTSLVSCCCVARRLSRADFLSVTREVESPQVQHASDLPKAAAVGAPPKDPSKGSHRRSPARLKMQVATDERCCEDAATRRSLALDRLQALRGLEGDYYSSCSSQGTPPMLTVARAAAPRRRQARRRSTRPAGSAGASGGGGGICSGGNSYRAMRGGVGGSAGFRDEGASFGRSPTFRYLAKYSESRGRVCSWAYGGTFRGRREQVCVRRSGPLLNFVLSCEKSSTTSAYPAELWAG